MESSDAGTLITANNLATTLTDQAKYAEAEGVLQATLEARRRVLGSSHPDTLGTAQDREIVRSAILRAEHPTTGRTGRGGKAAARRKERAAAPALSPTALAQAEARARVAEAELLALLDLEESDAAVASGGGSSGKGKGKAKGIGKAKGPGGK